MSTLESYLGGVFIPYYTGALSVDDILAFYGSFYANGEKSSQDAFILKHMIVEIPKMAKKKIQSTRCHTVKYYVRKPGAELVRVCHATFCAILAVGRWRVNSLAKHWIKTGQQKRDKRGGARISPSITAAKAEIRRHIESFHCRSSHYSRQKQTFRKYLPPELSIKRMWNMFSGKNPDLIVKYSLYRSVFRSEYNLAFGNPRSDICAVCESRKMEITNTSDTTRKAELITLHRFHTMQAARFYSLMNHNDHPELKAITIAFDIQQNLPLPKTSISEAFYARQAWHYNMAFVIHDKDENDKVIQDKSKVFIYTWSETQGGKSSNECTSAIMDFLNKEVMQDVQLVRLFSDSCAAQNKNMNLLTALLHFVTECRPGLLLQHYYPVRGHSYMPPDRVFGRIERSLRRRETILLPDEYNSVVAEHGTVRVLGVDWEVYDYKSAGSKICKKKLPFQLTKVRMLQITQNRVDSKATYSGEFSTSTVTKRGCKIANFQLNKLPLKCVVKPAKAKDVKMLLDKMGVTVDTSEDLKNFYNPIFAKISGVDKNEANSDIEEFEDDDIDY